MQKNRNIISGVIDKNTVVVVAGPTASGKSGLALDLAQQYNGVIINADASQVYKDIPIISAAPSAEDKQKVEHLLYEVFDARQNGSVTDWLKLAVEAIKNVWNRGMVPIVVGGTGFYIESLVKGVSPIPETSQKIKQDVADMLKNNGLATVYACLQKLDPVGAERVNPNDTTRVRRALEIFLDTGKSIDYWFQVPMVKMLPEAKFRMIVLLPQLKKLEEKCSLRFDEMMKNGALDEVKKLKEKKLDKNLPVMKAIGVPELMSFLDKKMSKKDAADLAKLRTRQYAKRQLTWFRNRMKNVADCIIEEI